MTERTPTPADVVAEIEAEERARAAAHSRVTCIDGATARAAVSYLRSRDALVVALIEVAEIAERGIDMGGGIGFLHPAVKKARALASSRSTP